MNAGSFTATVHKCKTLAGVYNMGSEIVPPLSFPFPSSHSSCQLAMFSLAMREDSLY